MLHDFQNDGASFFEQWSRRFINPNCLYTRYFSKSNYIQFGKARIKNKKDVFICSDIVRDCSFPASL